MSDGCAHDRITIDKTRRIRVSGLPDLYFPAVCLDCGMPGSVYEVVDREQADLVRAEHGETVWTKREGGSDDGEG